jgi:hypothetical protein
LSTSGHVKKVNRYSIFYPNSCHSRISSTFQLSVHSISGF